MIREIHLLLVCMAVVWLRNTRDTIVLWTVKNLLNFLLKNLLNFLPRGFLLPLALWFQLKLDYKKTKQLKDKIEDQIQNFGRLLYASYVK